MNNRLNKIYEEIYSIEDQIIDCEMRKASAEQNTLTKDNVYKMLLVFDKMNDADKRKLIESMILKYSFIQRKHGRRKESNKRDKIRIFSQ